MIMPPINLNKWIDQHAEELKPPVSNKVIYKDSEFIIMVVGGPNTRKDFHINQGEEFFYQIRGEMNLKMVMEGKIIDCPIGPGEIFLLPPRIPHGPQRPADTIGLVIERTRRPEEIDSLVWYCDKCQTKLHSESTHLTDIGTQIKAMIEKFYSQIEHTTCKKCGHVNGQN